MPREAEVVEIPIEKRRRNRLLSLKDLREMPRPKPLIQDVLYSNMEHNVFGPQGVTKTFLVIDWALHIAYQKRWMAKRVERGRTLIICGEGGGRMLADRIDAWLAYHEVSDDKAAQDMLRITELPVQMLDAEQVDEILDLIGESGPFDLIAIDTLAANFGPGDENTQADMSRFCDAMRRVRLTTGAGVLVVHHTGHADKTRPQGANNLRRNIDIELRLDRDSTDETLYGLVGGGDLKSRHGVGAGLIPYRLKSVETGERDAYGDPITSCVIVATQDIPAFENQRATTSGLGKNQRTVLEILRKIAATNGLDLNDPEGVYISSAEFQVGYKTAKLSKQSAYDVRKGFLKRGWIVEATGGFLWFPTQ